MLEICGINSLPLGPKAQSGHDKSVGGGAVVQQIADWLEKLGMSEYARHFAENDIDFAILRDLTDQDLEKIGVASLGHRRKLLRAINGLLVILGQSGQHPLTASYCVRLFWPPR
jgi:hypothetical protein